MTSKMMCERLVGPPRSMGRMSGGGAGSGFGKTRFGSGAGVGAGLGSVAGMEAVAEAGVVVAGASDGDDT